MILLYENQYISKDLEKFIKEKKELNSYFSIDFKGIKPKNCAGFLVLGNENHFILPKISNSYEKNLQIFIYMLIYVYDLNLKNIDFTNLADIKVDTIFKAFIEFFSKNLLFELQKGIYKNYRKKEENLRVLKGNYLFERNFTNFFYQKIYCSYDNFSSNNELNRFFLYAIKIFKNFSNDKNLYRCESIFDEVEFKHIDYKRMNISFDRLNSRFEKSYEIAKIILSHLISFKQNRKSFAFLFDMGELFEKFIAKLVKEIYPEALIQKEANFGNLKLKPDILIPNKLIIDTKYKIIKSKEDISTNDKYQMFTYGKNFKIKDTLLLYPKFDKDVDEILRLGKGEKAVILKIKNIELDYQVDYDNYIKNLKKYLKEML